MSAPLRWRVGDVTVTRIVESGGASSPLFASVSPTFLFSNLSAEAVQSQAWLQAAFRDRRRSPDRVDPRLRRRVARQDDRRRHLRRQRQGARPAGVDAAERPVPRRLRRRRLRARRRRRRAVHAPALRSRRLEHAPRRRPLGADVPARALPPEPPRLRRPRRGRRRQLARGARRFGGAGARCRPGRLGGQLPRDHRRGPPRADARAHAGPRQRAHPLGRAPRRSSPAT